MKKYWFKRKKHGWGWTPATLEGWLATAVYIIAVANVLISTGYKFKNSYDVWSYAVPVIFILTALFLFVTYITGEKPLWHWREKSAKKRRK